MLLRMRAHRARRRPVVAALCAGLLTVFPLSPLHAQAAVRSDSLFDLSRLRAGTDSFVVQARGNPIGWQRLVRTPQADGWELRDAITLGGMVTQESVIAVDARGRERSLRQTGTMRGAPMRIALDFTDVAGGRRVQGSASTPSLPTPLAVDTIVSVGTFDDNAITPLLPAVRWHEGFDVQIPVLSSGKGTVSMYRLQVQAADTVTVPAGRFDVWRVSQQVERFSVTMFITRAAPYRVVRMRQDGSGLDIVLAAPPAK